MRQIKVWPELSEGLATSTAPSITELQVYYLLSSPYEPAQEEIRKQFAHIIFNWSPAIITGNIQNTDVMTSLNALLYLQALRYSRDSDFRMVV